MSDETDKWPPTQYLIMEVLAARWRTGETSWLFPARLNLALSELSVCGMLDWESAGDRMLRARLTDKGRKAVMPGGYVPPVQRRARDEVLGLISYRDQLLAEARAMTAGGYIAEAGVRYAEARTLLDQIEARLSGRDQGGAGEGAS